MNSEKNREKTIKNPAIVIILSILLLDSSTSGSPSRGDDVISGFSSRGTTDDGRKKPDVVAPGHSIYSPSSEWEGNPECGDDTFDDGDEPCDGHDFVEMSGTSMATPHVAGVALWLSEAGLDPREVKALLINSAEDLGNSGWDKAYGWGYIDMDQAYSNVDETYQDTIDDTPEGEVEHFYTVDIEEDDKVTLVWDRHIEDYEDNSSGYDLNNLVLCMYDETDEDQISCSESLINNVQQIVSPGDYSQAVVKIEPYSTFSGVSTEDYGLSSTDDLTRVNPPNFTVIVVSPLNVDPGSTFTVNVSVENTGEIYAHDVDVTLNLPDGFTTSDPSEKSMGVVEDDDTEIQSWTVTASTTPGNYQISADVESNSYGDTFESTNSTQITVNSSCSGSVPSSGDWIIAEDTYCVNCDIALDEGGDTIIQPDNKLRLENATLTLDSVDGGDSFIHSDGVFEVLDGGMDTMIMFIT